MIVLMKDHEEGRLFAGGSRRAAYRMLFGEDATDAEMDAAVDNGEVTFTELELGPDQAEELVE